MKKFTAVLLALSVLFLLTACSAGEDETTLLGRVSAINGKTITISVFGNSPMGGGFGQGRPSDSDFGGLGHGRRPSDSDFGGFGHGRRPSDSDFGGFGHGRRPSDSDFGSFGQGRMFSASDMTGAREEKDIDVSKAIISRSDGISAIASDIKVGDIVTIVAKGKKATSVTINVR